MDGTTWYIGPNWRFLIKSNNETHEIESLYNFGTALRIDGLWHWIDPYDEFMDYYREIADKYGLYLAGIDTVVYGGITSCDVDGFWGKDLGYDFVIGTWICGENTIVKDLMAEMGLEDDNEQSVLELFNELSDNQLELNKEIQYEGIRIKIIKVTDDDFKKQFLAKKIED